MTDIYNIYEDPIIDETTERILYRSYNPIAGTNLNSGEIRITIDQSDFYLLPSKAFLLVEGKFTKSDGTAYSATDSATLTNNGIMHLFDRVVYQLSGNDVESINSPGRASTMLGLLIYPYTFQSSKGLSQLCYKDYNSSAAITGSNANIGFQIRQSWIVQNPTTPGKFSFRISLKHIFGFCDDYNKVIYGPSQSLILMRSSDNNAIYRASTVAAGKVDVQKISLYMPLVEPESLQKDFLKNSRALKQDVKVAFRKRKLEFLAVPQTTTFCWTLTPISSFETPRYIIVGFQTSKEGDQTTNPSIFDHCDLKNMQIEISSNSKKS
ncbi:uncharacterized protein LOC136091727 [Hydra vulgaris]|uniref:Uncharacterized protein LOC136091727 n=1 Tax=Hydra vulgaris TaxID=6087 RepID=A0ABM4DLT1_HYDVU